MDTSMLCMKGYFFFFFLIKWPRIRVQPTAGGCVNPTPTGSTTREVRRGRYCGRFTLSGLLAPRFTGCHYWFGVYMYALPSWACWRFGLWWFWWAIRLSSSPSSIFFSSQHTLPHYQLLFVHQLPQLFLSCCYHFLVFSSCGSSVPMPQYLPRIDATTRVYAYSS